MWMTLFINNTNNLNNTLIKGVAPVDGLATTGSANQPQIVNALFNNRTIAKSSRTTVDRLTSSEPNIKLPLVHYQRPSTIPDSPTVSYRV
ncbi:hypothetical protein JTE90_006514 [Oedothorax gibbosus]|uniref:Uncharacterized protein n=1 Tax=Oedothorax gibbosus TaxID=931172 RepID=A0AAV6VMW1_9ARAC|nr:hypothetical protein JTE90_006514 [Oedothorax gibbosus]